MKILFACFFSFLFIFGCSSTRQIANTPTTATGNNWSIAHTSHRHLELEPCGCEFNPLGGLEREWNLVNKWKNEGEPLFVTASGTTFIPEASNFKTQNVNLYLSKADFLVRGMGAVGVQALAPSIDDFRLGEEQLKQLASKASFPWVTTNLVSKKTNASPFPQSVEVKQGNISLLILGITHLQSNEYPTHTSELKVLPPSEALKKFFQTHSPKDQFVVLLSSLPKEEAQALQVEFPQIHLVLGASKHQSTQSIEQVTYQSLFANPMHSGRAVARVVISDTKPKQNFFNPSVASAYASAMESWQHWIGNIDRKLGKKLRSENKALKEERAKYLSYIDRGKKIPVKASENTVSFEGIVTDLDRSYSEPKNEMTKLIEQYKNNLRELALEGKN